MERVMPLYHVVSGDFTTTICRLTHQQAATDAIGQLRSGRFSEMRLGVLTAVTLDGDLEEDSFFFSTLNLVKTNGLDYKEN